MPENYSVELEVSHSWNCEICLCAKLSCSHIVEGPKLAALSQHIQPLPHMDWTKQNATQALYSMGFGGGITIVKGSCQVGRAAQKVPFLLYNLQKDFFHSRWFCSTSYTGCWTDLLGSQTCSCKMVNHLHSKTCIQIIQVLKTMPFCIAKGFSLCDRSQLATHGNIAH